MCSICVVAHYVVIIVYMLHIYLYFQAVDIDPCLENRPVTKKTILLSDCLELFTTMEKLGEQDPW